MSNVFENAIRALVDALAKTMPGFPAGAEETLCELLEIHLKYPSDTWFVMMDFLEHHDRWPGTKTLVDACKRICPEKARLQEQMTDPYPAAPEWRSPQDPPPDLCARCESWGHVLVNGMYERCECENGRAIEERYLASLNRRTAKADPPRARTKVVQIAAACSLCKGKGFCQDDSGRYARCSCAAGASLAPELALLLQRENRLAPREGGDLEEQEEERAS